MEEKPHSITDMSAAQLLPPKLEVVVSWSAAGPPLIQTQAGTQRFNPDFEANPCLSEEEKCLSQMEYDTSLLLE